MRRGVRVPKTDVRVEACGACDELNAALGMAVVAADDAGLASVLQGVQSAVFAIGADIADTARTPSDSLLPPAAVEGLERAIDAWDAPLPALTRFILPGGNELAARLHVARAVCRRAERAVVAVRDQFGLNPTALAYLNRLSDLLFVLARSANHRSGVGDPIWQPPSRADE